MNIKYEHSADWAVIGGGLMGQLTALGLVRQGHQVAHIFSQMSDDPRTSGIMTSSVALLKDLDIWHMLEGEAYPLTHIRLFDGTDHIIRAPEISFSSDEIGLEAFGYNVVNQRLVDIIQQTLATEDRYLHVPHHAQDFDYRENGWDIRAEAHHIKTPLIAACEGRHSPSRRAANISCKRTPLPQSALVATLKLARDHQHCSSEFHFEGGPLTLVPAQDRVAHLVWMDARADIKTWLACDETDFTEIIFEKTSGLLGPYHLISPRRHFEIDALEVETMAKQRVFLVGESGHVLPPLGAQGLNLGMRDLKNLLSLSYCAAAPEHCVDAYNQGRQSDLKQTYFGTMTLNQLMLDAHLGTDLIKASGLALLKRFPRWRQWLAHKGVGT